MTLADSGWVIAHSPTKGVDRLMMLILSDRTDEHHVAWMRSLEDLTHPANMEVGEVKESLARLEADGHIVRVTYTASPDFTIGYLLVGAK